MKNLNPEPHLQDVGWYVLRTPLFPVVYQQSVAQCHTADDFKQLFDHPHFKEAIYLASPHLYHQFDKWLRGTITFRKDPEKEERKLLKSLLKYWLRATYRCTPFATFAGITAPGNLGNHTQITLGDIQRYNRIDAEYLYLATNELMKEDVQPQYRPSTSLYAYDAHSLRYFERITKVNPKKPDEYLYQYHFTKIDQNEYLEALLKFCETGATIPQMIAFLEQKGVDHDEAQAYVVEVVTSQMLTGDAQGATVGQEYQAQLLPKWTHGATLLSQLRQAQTQEDYQSLANKLTQLMRQKMPNIQKVISSFFHVDTIRQTQQNQLDQTVVDQLTQVVTTLANANPLPENYVLNQFKTDFQNRYGEAFVPLNQALDPENGIAYPSYKKALRIPFALLNLPFGRPKAPSETTITAWGRFVLERYLSFITTPQSVWSLTSDEINQHFKSPATSPIALPDTLSVMASLIGPQKIHLNSISISGTALLGRFCHADAHLAQKVAALHQHEQAVHPEILIAEITHNPAPPKTYNILNRPHRIRAYKLLVSSNPAYFTPEETIRTQDLWIGVVNQEIVLYDQSRQKRVLPRLTSAHNYTGSNYPLYQFLCDLAYQSYGVSHWDWGPLASQPFLPRVEIDDVVVSPARWVIKQPEDLDQPHIPTRFLLTYADHQLLIDQNIELAKEIVLDELKKRKSVILKEVLFEEYVVKDGQGQGYTNQIILPLKNKTPKPLRSNFNIAPNPLHLLGGRWVYFKIYCGVITAEELLKGKLSRLIEQLKEAQLIEQWFFIRYRDQEGTHLRIRLQTSSLTTPLFQLINQALEPAIASRKIRVVYDTYVTEAQRYGGSKNLLCCEQLFYHDSEMMVALLQKIDEDKGDDAEMFVVPLALKNIDTWLNDFGYELPQKYALTKKIAEGFRKEFKVGKILKKALANSYRSLQSLPPLGEGYHQLFAHRSQTMAPVVAQIQRHLDQGICQVPLDQLFASIAHMSLNRLFLEKPREQELLTYDCLEMNYKAQIARAQYPPKE